MDLAIKTLRYFFAFVRFKAERVRMVKFGGKFLKYQDFPTLQEFHVEITNRCNAACPMCGRNVFGGREKDSLVLDEWTKEDAEKVFDARFTGVRNILFCGTHGEPASAKACLEILTTARAKLPKATFEFYSNGSVRSPSWWADLAGVMKYEQGRGQARDFDLGVFSIDGLDDTNHLYRRKTNFAKIMENAEAFIAAGGRARWDFLVFKHNEHQVEEAELLAKKMGFRQFRIRKTSRFAHSPDGPLKYRVQNNAGEIEYYLEPPTKPEYQNRQIEKFHEAVEKGRMGETALTNSILCLYKTRFGRMYVNAHMKVYPCCFVSSDTFMTSGNVWADTKARVTEKYGEVFNSLKHFNWQEIIDHPWFAKELVESWKKPEESLLRCQRTCGAGMNPIISQSQDRLLPIDKPSHQLTGPS